MAVDLTGGLDDGRSWGSAKDSFTVEKGVEFGRGRVEVRQYVWRHATDDVQTRADYFLGLALTPRPGPTRAAYPDAGRHISGRIGNILFIPPGQMVRSGGGPGTFRALECILPSAMVDDVLHRTPAWGPRALTHSLQLSNLEVEWLLSKLHQELQQAGFASRAKVEALATALAVALVRHFRLERDEGPQRAGGLAPWRMRLIRERVYADQPVPGLTELAELCGMSVRHLSRAFKVETGRTIAKFVEAATVDRARDMLGAADLPIAQIAKTLGFSSAASFAYAFRRATGMRPSELGRRRRSPSYARSDLGGRNTPAPPGLRPR